MNTRSLLFLCGALLAAPTAGAQRWRTLDASRQVRDTSALSVHVTYGAGRIDLRPATPGMLYAMNIRYDADHSEPYARFDSAAHTLDVGIHSQGNIHLSKSDRNMGTFHAELSNRVPMELEMELGAVEGELQLGGLRLTEFALKGGAADLEVRFDQPNPARMRRMTLEVGAADVKVLRAGNAAPEFIRASVGVGSLSLDLGGEWTRDIELDANVALGGLSVRVPPDVGVRIDATTFLVGFEKAGLVKRGDVWLTPEFDAAKRHVRIRMKGAFGSFDLSRDTR
jgi:hypothetical protein